MSFSVQKLNFDIGFDIEFDVNGGDSITFSKRKYTVGKEFKTLPIANKANAYFDGFGKELSSDSTILSSDIVDYFTKKYYAQYTNPIDLSFNADIGHFSDSTTIKTLQFYPKHFLSCGSSFPENPTCDELAFIGWYTGLSGQGTKITSQSICPNETQTYYAHYISQSYSVNLNSQWQTPTQWTNTDTRFVVYESNSNYHVGSGVATMYINLTGYTDFTLYINSYAESYYDYTRAYEKDSSTIKVTTTGCQYNPSSYVIDSGTGWKKVTYSLDGGTHQIKIDYRKDGSVDDNWDRGYVAIPAI